MNSDKWHIVQVLKLAVIVPWLTHCAVYFGLFLCIHIEATSHFWTESLYLRLRFEGYDFMDFAHYCCWTSTWFGPELQTRFWMITAFCHCSFVWILQQFCLLLPGLRPWKTGNWSLIKKKFWIFEHQLKWKLWKDSLFHYFFHFFRIFTHFLAGLFDGKEHKTSIKRYRKHRLREFKIQIFQIFFQIRFCWMKCFEIEALSKIGA